MLPAEEFYQLPGGLCVAVLPFSRATVDHRDLLSDELRNAIKHEATIHGAGFSELEFKRVLQALNAGNVRAYFFLATWNVSQPKIMGATIGWQTVIMQRVSNDIKIGIGEHSEDLCVMSSKIRELISDRPPGYSFPSNIGLAECFEAGNIIAMQQCGVIARTGEFAPRNVKMVKLLTQFGTTLGAEPHSAMLEAQRFPAIVGHGLEETNRIINLSFNNKNCGPNNLVLGWSNDHNNQKIVASFTVGISTFTGKSVFQIQAVSNGNLSQGSNVEKAICALLVVAQEQLSAFHMNDKDQPFSSRSTAPAHLPQIRVHVLNEPEILDAFLSVGFERRYLGSREEETNELGSNPTMPLIQNFINIPEERFLAWLPEADIKDAA